MSDRLSQLRATFSTELIAATTDAEATTLRDRWLGRKNGLITAEMKTLGALSPDERKAAGQQINDLKNIVEAEIETLQARFAAEREAAQLAAESIDITLPGSRIPAGHLHPITLLRHKIEDIFVSMGYEIEDGPEIETNFYNFDSLNIPANHPARS
ncbi:MAG: phenylalanine--tRNA ligase subunit alpha, partial [Acidobacteria bacterium]|nr:phenylalanine--tRNA ligase subunit alpha [Acidobacteriota bacterium]